ncbi:MAG: hypothetical protein RL154_1543 [Pseudomonadota bacterium]|jgi:purine-binding chemotaxis protein CheW
MSENLKKNNNTQCLSFYIKDEMFSLDASFVKEIIQYTQITRVPMMQSFVVGITNIRGSVIPVLDLSDRLGMGKSNIEKKTCIITIEANIDNEDMEIGIVVDVVDQVYDVSHNARMDAPEFGSKIRKDFISMIAKIDEKFIVLLNVDALVNLEELSVVNQQKSA